MIWLTVKNQETKKYFCNRLRFKIPNKRIDFIAVKDRVNKLKTGQDYTVKQLIMH